MSAEQKQKKRPELTPEQLEALKPKSYMRWLNYLSSNLFLIIAPTSFLLSVLPMILSEKMAWILVAPFIFILTFPLLAMILARYSSYYVVRGLFPRDPMVPVYGHRKMFGSAWTSVYYFKGLYHILISVSFLKKFLFRGFRYKGKMNFVVYPDSWIRDLPLLSFGDKVYISNRATVGTNICLADGRILVDSITLDDGCLIGHLGVLGPGLKFKRDSEMGVKSVIGIRTVIGEKTFINSECIISHGVLIGDNVKMGLACRVGRKCKIADGLDIPDFTIIPQGTDLRNQEDVHNCQYTTQQQLKSSQKDIWEKIKKAEESFDHVHNDGSNISTFKMSNDQ